MGCGRIAGNHLNAISKLPDRFELVGVCDPDPKPKLLSEIVDRQIPLFSSIQDLVEAKDTDIVSLCTPSGLHCSQAIYFANKGIHVITEKPMATRWADGLKMVDTFEKKKLHLFVVKQNRYNDTVRALKRACEQKRFGKIHMFNVNVFWTRAQEYYDQASWRGTWEMDGGALMNQASHYVDMVEWLLGPVETVQSLSSTYRNIEVEDTITLNLKMRNGALGSMNVTMLTHRQNLEGSITIIGEKGTAKLGGVAANEIQVWDFEDSSSELDGVADLSYKTESVYGFGHLNYYKSVIDILDGKEATSTMGSEGLKSLEIIIAAYESAKTNKSIRLPLSR